MYIVTGRPAGPCSGVWRLVENAVDCIHSSDKYYDTGKQGVFLIMGLYAFVKNEIAFK